MGKSPSLCQPDLPMPILFHDKELVILDKLKCFTFNYDLKRVGRQTINQKYLHATSFAYQANCQYINKQDGL